MADRIFADRDEAGRLLADEVAKLRLRKPVVLALPRGGVPVAAQVAARLNAPLDLVLVRKLGAPGQPELAIGAVVDGKRPEIVLNEEIIRLIGVSKDFIEAEMKRQLEIIEKRRKLYYEGHQHPELKGHDVVVIDDGVATGATLRSALHALRRQEPSRLIAAVPVAPAETVELLRRDADEVVCLETPYPFGAIGYFYRDFSQVSDETVAELLHRARLKQ